MKSLMFVIFGMLMASAFAQNFRIASNLAASYEPGASGTVSISVQLLNPDLDFSQAVVFLNIVEIDERRTYPQVMHQLFSAADAAPDIFKTVYSKEQLLNGVSTNLVFFLRDNAKPGSYSMAIQVFSGNNTDPNRVRVQDRLGIQNFGFSID
ncbi:MAG: hypothetical protein GFH24_608434n15 [Chloroflexi bacterium AL-N5]|nr:hypothetical protein [Chloroflexi bacterium AL-N5]